MYEKVSIIIPVYNAESYLKDCIQSIIQQTYENIEILLINDGSTDSSGLICSEFEEKDGRIIVITKQNAGVSAARNTGIDQSTGSYLMFIDSDDLLTQNAVGDMVNAIQKSKVQAAYFNYIYDYDNARVKRIPKMRSAIYEVEDIHCRLIDSGTMSGILFPSVWAVLYSASVIRDNKIRFDERIRVNEDGLFNIVFCKYAKQIQYCGDIYAYIYRKWKPGHIDVKEKSKQFSLVDRAVCQEVTGFMDETLIKKQMTTRRIFVVFQLSLMACNRAPYRGVKKMLVRLWKADELKEYRRNLNLQDITLYKFILCSLMRYHCYMPFYLLIHYAYPILSRRIKR